MSYTVFEPDQRSLLLVPLLYRLASLSLYCCWPMVLLLLDPRLTLGVKSQRSGTQSSRVLPQVGMPKTSSLEQRADR